MRMTRTKNPKRLISLDDNFLQRMNIGLRYWQSDMKSVPDCTLKNILRNYMQEIHKNYNQGWGVFIYGGNGVGKTYTSCALLKEVAKTGYSTFCILSDELKLSYIDGSRFDKDNSVTQRVEYVDFLLIEDLGKEYSGKGSGFAELCFENLLRKRSRECRPTFITTNLTPAAFKERYKQSAASLAMECMVCVEMRGEDRRVQMSSQKSKGLS